MGPLCAIIKVMDGNSRQYVKASSYYVHRGAMYRHTMDLNQQLIILGNGISINNLEKL